MHSVKQISATRRVFYLVAILFIVSMIVGGSTTYILYSVGLKNEASRLSNISKVYADLVQQCMQLKFPGKKVTLDNPHFRSAIEESLFSGLNQPESQRFDLIQPEEDRHTAVFQKKAASATMRFARYPPESLDLIMTRTLQLRKGLVKENIGFGTYLAAVHPVGVTGVFIVISTDLNIFRAPYIRAAINSVGIALFIIVIGSLFLFQTSQPLIGRLDASDSLNKAVIESSINAIITIDAKGIILTANSSVERLFGYAVSDIIGKNVSMLMPSPYRDEHDSYIAAFINTGEKRIIGLGREVSAMKKDGTLFPAYLSVNEMVVSKKQYFTGIIQDLSALRSAESEVLELSQKLIEVQEEERDRISREIHDNVGTSLFLLKMQLQSYFARLEEADKSSQKEIIDTLTMIVETARTISHDLSPVALRELGLGKALEQLVERFEKSTEITVERDFRLLDEYFKEKWNINIYRIVQEALNNIIKHSRANQVTIRGYNEKDLLVLAITDNGTGIAESDLQRSKITGLGLSLMRERAHLLGAEIRVNTMPGKGLEVRLEFKRRKI